MQQKIKMMEKYSQTERKKFNKKSFVSSKKLLSVAALLTSNFDQN